MEIDVRQAHGDVYVSRQGWVRYDTNKDPIAKAAYDKSHF